MKRNSYKKVVKKFIGQTIITISFNIVWDSILFYGFITATTLN